MDNRGTHPPEGRRGTDTLLVPDTQVCLAPRGVDPTPWNLVEDRPVRLFPSTLDVGEDDSPSLSGRLSTLSVRFSSLITTTQTPCQYDSTPSQHDVSRQKREGRGAQGSRFVTKENRKEGKRGRGSVYRYQEGSQEGRFPRWTYLTVRRSPEVPSHPSKRKGWRTIHTNPPYDDVSRPTLLQDPETFVVACGLFGF